MGGQIEIVLVRPQLANAPGLQKTEDPFTKDRTMRGLKVTALIDQLKNAQEKPPNSPTKDLETLRILSFRIQFSTLMDLSDHGESMEEARRKLGIGGDHSNKPNLMNSPLIKKIDSILNS